MTIALKPLTLLDKLKSRNVTRWHTVLTTKEQSVADHSHCMGIICEDLLNRLFQKIEKKPSLEDKYFVLKYSQVHDLPELFTSDISSVFKSMLRDLIPEFEDINEQIEFALVPELLEMSEVFSEKPYLKLVCKAGDLIEAVNYFTYAKGTDLAHNRVIEEKLHEGLQDIIKKGKLDSPFLDWNAINEILENIKGADSAIVHFETVKIFK